MPQNISSSIHNRVSTLCQAYVRKTAPEVWAKFREKAEHEYKFQQRRRNTDEDIEQALKNIKLVKIPEITVSHGAAPGGTNFWGH
jgi:hypothetical protein